MKFRAKGKLVVIALSLAGSIAAYAETTSDSATQASAAFVYSEPAARSAMHTALADSCSDPWYTFSLIQMGTCMAIGEWW
ncbi:hypothetical protein WS90_24675 [Burkholderia cepacia]|uniref:Uncharacterized protein n=1 Tax=Burkholderia cepacia TaxID=292 RepID=A0A118KEX1_BURCE|nr:hypothetical protein [Burkholderia cepacia]KVK76396.1 hypothetical protein WS90_24675 [Burkholderia cepacia]